MELLQYLATVGDAAMVAAAAGLWKLDRRLVVVETMARELVKDVDILRGKPCQ